MFNIACYVSITSLVWMPCIRLLFAVRHRIGKQAVPPMVKQGYRYWYVSILPVMMFLGLATIVEESSHVDQVCLQLQPGTPVTEIPSIVASHGHVRWYQDKSHADAWRTVICAASTLCEHRCTVYSDDRVITRNSALRRQDGS